MIKKMISKDDYIFMRVNDIFLIICLLLAAYPMIYIISASLSSPESMLTSRVILWPVGFSLEGYKAVFRDKYLLTGYGNTIFYTFFGTIINVAMTVLAAYPLSRKGFKGRNIIMFMFTFTMIFNGGLIPTYLLVWELNMVNTRWAMLIPSAMTVWNVIITRTYFQTTIGNELLEAAQIDGCNHIRFLMGIVLPLSKPIIAVQVLFYGVGHWNAFFDAFLYLSKKELYPLQIILRDILIINSVDANMTMDVEEWAAKQGLAELLKYSLIIVASLPVWCAYPFVQKYFVKGVMIGSIKG